MWSDADDIISIGEVSLRSLSSSLFILQVDVVSVMAVSSVLCCPTSLVPRPPPPPSFSVLHAEKREGLGDKITRNVITASYLMNMGEINHWNAVNGLFERAFEATTVEVA